MQNINERPICHRAEDLVTYLYGESSPGEAQEFAHHAKHCDACAAELNVFQQVHESIAEWRTEALGSLDLTPQIIPAFSQVKREVVKTPQKLSAIAALRQFFTVSPVWLRGAAAFATLLLCVLSALVITRVWQRPVEVSGQQGYTREQVDQEVKVALERQAQQAKASTPENPVAPDEPKAEPKTPHVATNIRRTQPKRNKGMTRQEWDQLAADLGLVPGNEELPFAISEEPE